MRFVTKKKKNIIYTYEKTFQISQKYVRTNY